MKEIFLEIIFRKIRLRLLSKYEVERIVIFGQLRGYIQKIGVRVDVSVVMFYILQVIGRGWNGLYLIVDFRVMVGVEVFIFYDNIMGENFDNGFFVDKNFL